MAPQSRLMIFRENVLRLMRERGISFRQLAADLGTSPSYVHGILKSGTMSPNVSRVEEIANYFETPLPELFEKRKPVRG